MVEVDKSIETSRAEAVARLQMEMEHSTNGAALPHFVIRSNKNSKASSSSAGNSKAGYYKTQQFSCPKTGGPRFFSGDRGAEVAPISARVRARTCLRREEDVAVHVDNGVGPSICASGSEQEPGTSKVSLASVGSYATSSRSCRPIARTRIQLSVENRGGEESVRSLLGGQAGRTALAAKGKVSFFNPPTRAAYNFHPELEGRTLQFSVSCEGRSLVLVYHLFDETLSVIVPEAVSKDGWESIDARGSVLKRGRYPIGRADTPFSVGNTVTRFFKPEDLRCSLGKEVDIGGYKYKLLDMCPFTKKYFSPTNHSEGKSQEQVESQQALGAEDGLVVKEDSADADESTQTLPETTTTATSEQPPSKNKYLAPGVSETALQQILKDLLTGLQQGNPRTLFRQFDKTKDNRLCFRDFQGLLYAYRFRVADIDACRLFQFFCNGGSSSSSASTAGEKDNEVSDSASTSTCSAAAKRDRHNSSIFAGEASVHDDTAQEQAATSTTSINFETFLAVLHRDYASRAGHLLRVPAFSSTFLDEAHKEVADNANKAQVKAKVQYAAELLSRSARRPIIQRRFREEYAQKGSALVDSTAVAWAFNDPALSMTDCDAILNFLYSSKSNSQKPSISFVKFVADLEKAYLEVPHMRS
ncbi:unnamed protein product [Amoebophrya sp. A25]|nr:unnamed protein product [Amoebophrya sp. A25]|eukprot:GSA25T00011478001.1